MQYLILPSFVFIFKNILPSFVFIFKNKRENRFSILLRNFCCVFTDSSSIDQVNDNNKSRKRGDRAKAKGYSEGYFSYIFFGVNNINIYLNRVVYYVSALFFVFFRWVEFASKSNAKRVANLLNCEQIDNL